MIKRLSLLVLCVLTMCQCQTQKESSIQMEDEQQEKVFFHAIVASDGSGSHTTVQAAIDAAPTLRKEPWIIYIKNGSYNEQVIIPKNKPYIHLIGQDKNKTIIHIKLNVGGQPQEGEADKTGYWTYSVHNPEGKVYNLKGAVCYVEGDHFFARNISFINDWGVESQNGPQALAMSSQADFAAFNECIFRSFQDTWMTTTKNDNHRHYVCNCFIEGAVDYFYGSGDVYVENSTFYSVREGSVIVAPCHKTSKWGYVIKNCIVDGNEKAANLKRWGTKLGRPWHNAPISVFINTTLNIPLNPQGWMDMGTVPGLFAEYNTRDAQGNVVDLSQRKSEYTYTKDGEKITGTSRTTITAEEAANYTYENVIMQQDGWDPHGMMEQLPAPKQIRLKENILQWEKVPNAVGYLLLAGETVLGITSKTLFTLPTGAQAGITIQAVNRFGTVGKATAIKLSSLNK